MADEQLEMFPVEETTPQQTELSPEEIDAIASVTLPLTGYDVRVAHVPTIDGEGTIEVIALPLELRAEDENFYIQPFMMKPDAEAFANAILAKVKGN